MIKVGTQKMLSVSCLENPAGTIGVCYEVYDRQPMGRDRKDDVKGYSFIFPNGNYDGFSTEDTEKFFTPHFGFVPLCQFYKFKNVLQLEKDYRNGFFDAGLKDGWLNFAVEG